MSIIIGSYLFSQTFENFWKKTFHVSLLGNLNSYKLIHVTQSGFRTNHLCETALVGMTDKCLPAINENHMVGTVVIDIR